MCEPSEYEQTPAPTQVAQADEGPCVGCREDDGDCCHLVPAQADETLAGLLAQHYLFANGKCLCPFNINLGSPVAWFDQHAEHQAQVILASDWLAAHVATIRAEREGGVVGCSYCGGRCRADDSSWVCEDCGSVAFQVGQVVRDEVGNLYVVDAVSDLTLNVHSTGLDEDLVVLRHDVTPVPGAIAPHRDYDSLRNQLGRVTRERDEWDANASEAEGRIEELERKLAVAEQAALLAADGRVVDLVASGDWEGQYSVGFVSTVSQVILDGIGTDRVEK